MPEYEIVQNKPNHSRKEMLVDHLILLIYLRPEIFENWTVPVPEHLCIVAIGILRKTFRKYNRSNPVPITKRPINRLYLLHIF